MKIKITVLDKAGSRPVSSVPGIGPPGPPLNAL